MKIDFLKYQGTGNDFVMLDNRDNRYAQLGAAEIERLCDRRFGIGGDGLMLLQDHPEYDFEMVYFNADGRVGSMCGNGGRCIVAFAKFLGIIDTETNFLAVDGPHYAKISADGNFVDLKMIDVSTVNTDGDAFVLNTGSPHYILYVNDLENMDVFQAGRAIRYNDTYKKDGINVNFVEPVGNILHVRTYERGVEDETYACGTGVTAVALSAAFKNRETGNQLKQIKVLGGNLEVKFHSTAAGFEEIFLSGPAVRVFAGSIMLP